MQYQVPQFIETEDKIIAGLMTLRQFLIVAAGCGLSFLFYFFFNITVWFLLTCVVGAAVAAIAFIKVHGRPLTVLGVAAFGYFWNPRFYLWQAQKAQAVAVPQTKTVVHGKAKKGFSFSVRPIHKETAETAIEKTIELPSDVEAAPGVYPGPIKKPAPSNDIVEEVSKVPEPEEEPANEQFAPAPKIRMPVVPPPVRAHEEKAVEKAVEVAPEPEPISTPIQAVVPEPVVEITEEVTAEAPIEKSFEQPTPPPVATVAEEPAPQPTHPHAHKRGLHEAHKHIAPPPVPKYPEHQTPPPEPPQAVVVPAPEPEPIQAPIQVVIPEPVAEIKEEVRPAPPIQETVKEPVAAAPLPEPKPVATPLPVESQKAPTEEKKPEEKPAEEDSVGKRLARFFGSSELENAKEPAPLKPKINEVPAATSKKEPATESPASVSSAEPIASVAPAIKPVKEKAPAKKETEEKIEAKIEEKIKERFPETKAEINLKKELEKEEVKAADKAEGKEFSQDEIDASIRSALAESQKERTGLLNPQAVGSEGKSKYESESEEEGGSGILEIRKRLESASASGVQTLFERIVASKTTLPKREKKFRLFGNAGDREKFVVMRRATGELERARRIDYK